MKTILNLCTLLLLSTCSAKRDIFYFRYGTSNIPADIRIEKGAGDDAWVAQSDLLVISSGNEEWA